MLTYNTQYNIISGMFTSFKNKRDKKQYTIRHSKEKREEMKKIFPFYKYETWTEQDFKILSLYILFYKSPASMMDAYLYLKEVDENHLETFKNEIKYWKKYLKQDIKTIKNYSNKVTNGLINDLYIMNKIKWYTVYYYYHFKGIPLENAHGRSRICNKLFKFIKKIHIYVQLPIEYKDLEPLLNDEINL